MTTFAFHDLKIELGAMPLDLMRAEIGRRGYRLEEWTVNDWTTSYRPRFSVMVIDDSVHDPADHWAGLVAFEMSCATEREALETVLEDIRIATWTITFKEAEARA